ncbi:MAG: pyridoxal 5'-phosphate synthase glutaminase subunit PdxT [Actinobacteria bacterium]|nr:pyridoxal 5'-phosphate synthase glutaminase subunit PdxT [Actinomycetota bacterium]
MSRPSIGIVALQGDYGEHASALESSGARVVEVRQPSDCRGLDGLVLPGGESTTISMLIESAGLTGPIGGLITAGLPVLGTCAGMIIMASEVSDGRPGQLFFKAIDIAVRRNGFGRQVHSFECDLEVAGIEGGPFRAVFIRAPAVERVGEGVEVLAGLSDGTPVACRQGNVLVASFHPELTGDIRFHQRFVKMARVRKEQQRNVGSFQVGDNQAS